MGIARMHLTCFLLDAHRPELNVSRRAIHIDYLSYRRLTDITSSISRPQRSSQDGICPISLHVRRTFMLSSRTDPRPKMLDGRHSVSHRACMVGLTLRGVHCNMICARHQLSVSVPLPSAEPSAKSVQHIGTHSGLPERRPSAEKNWMSFPCSF